MKKINKLFLLLLIAFQIFFVSTAYSQKNDKFIQSRQAIPNRYIVVLEDNNDVIRNFPNNPVGDEKVRRFTRELSLLYGGQVDRQYSRAIKGYAVAMPREQALALSRDPRVKYVEEDFFIFKDQTQTNATTGLDRIDQRNLPLNTIYNYSSTGAGVHAYVLDSGIRATHSEFTGRIGNGADFVNDGQGTNDCDGHGTHVAGTIGGTIYGVAKNVTIHPVRVLNCDGNSTGSSTISGIDWVTANRVPNAPGVVNMSLGGGYSTTSNNAVANSIAQTGLTYVVSAGNENNDACDKSPASTPQAITVGSSRPTTDIRSSFSNYGVCVDVFAPGSSITSASHNSDTGTAVFSGTSMSAPHVSGIVARFLQNNPNATPSQVENSVINSATNGVITDPGVGSPNRLAFADVVFNNTTPPPPTPGPAPAVRIPEQGVGTPYPSTYVVSGEPPVIGNHLGSVTVYINGFSHTATGEVSFLLEGPTGARILLQSGVGLNEDANNISYTFSDGGLTMLENSPIQGSSYKPTAYDLVNFPVPGPGTAYSSPGPLNGGTATLASTFGGTNPNGVWKLYVKDENLGDRGRVDNWFVRVSPPQRPSQPTNFRVTSVTHNQVSLSWDPNPANESVTSYRLVINGSVGINGITDTSYTVTGLAPNTPLYFSLEAVNLGGNSIPGSMLNNITTSSPPNGIYNAVNDFSSVINPNVSGFSPLASWAYGYFSPFNNTFPQFHSISGQPATGISSWTPQTASCNNCWNWVTKNTTGTTQTYYGSIVQPADLLNLHPGANGEKATVIWKAPSTGFYRVQGRFEGISTAGTTSDASIVQNGSVIWSNNINGFGATANYDVVVTLNAGDVIEFAVGYGNNNNYNNDSTGLAVNISPASSLTGLKTNPIPFGTILKPPPQTELLDRRVCLNRFEGLYKTIMNFKKIDDNIKEI